MSVRKDKRGKAIVADTDVLRRPRRTRLTRGEGKRLAAIIAAPARKPTAEMMEAGRQFKAIFGL